MTDTLQILRPNITVTFNTPLETENDVIVRTGIIPDGNCFFHALLYGYSKDYISMSETKRQEYVRRLKISLVGNINKDVWQEIGEGLIAKIPFEENFLYFLTKFYEYIKGVNIDKNRRLLSNILVYENEEREVYELLIDLIKIENFERDILPKSYAQDNIEKCKEQIVNNTIIFLLTNNTFQNASSNKTNYIKRIVRKLISEMVNEVETFTFENYKKSLLQMGEFVDVFTIEWISNRFNRDIYFLDSKTRMPYRMADTTNNLKRRKSIILLWINSCHYEILGKVNHGNKVQREFEANDPLILKLRTYLCEPDKIATRYPELITYLPKDYRKITDQSSEEEDSDSSSSSSEEEDEENDN